MSESKTQERAKTIPLEYPVAVGGKQYDAVTLKRLTQADVAAFVEKMGKDDKATTLSRFPIFYDVEGDLLPDAVYAALDDDDAYALEVAAADFLPRRFRPASAPAAATAPATGETTEPTL